jgi:hypothetical protein
VNIVTDVIPGRSAGGRGIAGIGQQIGVSLSQPLALPGAQHLQLWRYPAGRCLALAAFLAVAQMVQQPGDIL